METGDGVGSRLGERKEYRPFLPLNPILMICTST